jgi:hypothetical protein
VVLAGGDHHRRALGPRRRNLAIADRRVVAIGIDGHAQVTQAAACERTHHGEVHADTAGEGDDVDTAQRRRHRSNFASEPVQVHVESVAAATVAPLDASQHVAHVPAGP